MTLRESAPRPMTKARKEAYGGGRPALDSTLNSNLYTTPCCGHCR